MPRLTWRLAFSFGLGLIAAPGLALGVDAEIPSQDDTAQPSFDCAAVASDSIPARVCDDAALAALDRTLASAYGAALTRTDESYRSTLRATQRGWIKGRDDCWKSDDIDACVTEQYRLRIAELQARYRLIEGTGPVRYVCGDSPANELIATFFRTEPPTLIAERGDSVSLMYRQASGSGARYMGPNESFWEHLGEARVVWGHDAPEMICRRQY